MPPVRPDAGDDIEFLDESPAVPAVVDEAPDVPSLAEQRTNRRFRRGLASDTWGDAA